jgi:hypothetical protein
MTQLNEEQFANIAQLQDEIEKEQIVIILKGLQWDRSQHGGLFDRGSADSYYGRGPFPHYGGVGGELEKRVTDLSAEERAEYLAGYQYNERWGGKKEYY